MAEIEACLRVNGQQVSSTNPVPMVDAFQAPTTSTAWGTGSAYGAAGVTWPVNPLTSPTNGYDTVIVTVTTSGASATFTGGSVIFEVYDGINWINVKSARTDSYLTDGTYNLAGVPTQTTKAWQIPVAGFPYYRTRLATQIAGTNTPTIQITHIISSAPDTSIVTAGLDPTNTNQMTPAHLSPVVGGLLGGASIKHYTSLATTNANLIKNAPGRLVGWDLSNKSAAWSYVRLYNAAAVGTVGTGVVQTIGIAPGAKSTVEFSGGIAYTNGIWMSNTTGVADTDTTATAVNDVVGDLFFV